MSKLVWDASGAREFETGVSNAVLYPMSSTPGTYSTGVAWNGLTAVTESPEGAEVTPLYADNIKYVNLLSAENFKATIEAYMYPDEFAVCDGSATIANGFTAGQQDRTMFALCYRTEKGNDQNPKASYKIHIIYGCIAAPSERAHNTINDSPEAMTMSWEINTTPVAITGCKPSAHVVLDSDTVPSAKMTTILESLYGTDGQGSTTGTNPTLLLPDAIAAIINAVG